MAQDQFDLIIDALCSVRQIRDYHGGSVEAARQIDSVVTMLKGRAGILPVISEVQPLRRNELALAVADVIKKLYGNRSPTEATD